MAETPTILAIDDSMTIRKLLQMALVGFNVEMASTGREGIDRARQLLPEVVLLDYVLPDMKGIDVCLAMEQDERTRRIPIIVLSGKNREDLQQVFRGRLAVFDFVAKPFNGAAMAAVIARAMQKRSATHESAGHEPVDAEAAPVFSAAQKKAAAQVLYSRLRDRLGKIPDWLPQMGTEPAAVFFAKRLLTEDVVEKLMVELSRLLRDGSSDKSTVAAAYSPLQGSTALLKPDAVLAALRASARTGVLTVELPVCRCLLYLRRGEPVFAASTAPDESARQAVVGLDPALEESFEKAEAEQRRSGKPVYVSLAEAGKIPGSELPELLYEQGKRVLLDMLSADNCAFSWRDLPALPEYVEAYGRPYSPDNVELERLRETEDRLQVEMYIDSMDIVFCRGPQFSRNIRRFEFTDGERRVLTLVDGRNTVRQIVERSGVTVFEAFRILFRMSRFSLIRKRDGTPERRGAHAAHAGQTAHGGQTDRGDRGDEAASARPVLVFDADPSVREPLSNLLRRRHSVAVLEMEDDADPLARIVRERPRLAILDARSTPDVERIAREVRSNLEISDMALAVSSDRDSPQSAKSWRAAGFDAVLVKPYLFREVEALLGL